MTNEERQRTMDFIVAQQAQFWANMQKLEESQARAESRMDRAESRMDRSDHRTDRLERVVKLMIKAGLRARTQMREQSADFDRRFAALMEAQAHTDKRLDALAASQAHSDGRFDALIDIVREQRNGSS